MPSQSSFALSLRGKGKEAWVIFAVTDHRTSSLVSSLLDDFPVFSPYFCLHLLRLNSCLFSATFRHTELFLTTCPIPQDSAKLTFLTLLLFCPFWSPPLYINPCSPSKKSQTVNKNSLADKIFTSKLMQKTRDLRLTKSSIQRHSFYKFKFSILRQMPLLSMLTQGMLCCNVTRHPEEKRETVGP